MLEMFRDQDWMSWIRGLITNVLIVIVVGSYIISSQQQLTDAVLSSSKDSTTAIFNRGEDNIIVLCKLDDSSWVYSTDKATSDVKALDLVEVRIWNSGYIASEFSDGSVIVHSRENCIVNNQPKSKVQNLEGV